ncbi:MAG: DUF1802 family protein [Bryobacteraceae bacterium]|nr:DUF1802 family protein [Bryobacteraceae bacterium]
MNAALKEWSAVSEALRRGEQVALLRKGGIVEAERGGFHLRHSRFLLFPTFEHQQQRFLKTPAAPPAIGETLTIEVLAEAAGIFAAPSDPGILLAMGDEFIWNEAFVRQRYDYRPDLPLWLILIRAYTIPPTVIPNRPSYAGCKSWVNLSEEIAVDAAAPVLGEEAFSLRRQRLIDRLK